MSARAPHPHPCTPTDAQLGAFRSLVSGRLGLALPERFDRHLSRALFAVAEMSGAAGAEAVRQRLEILPWTAPEWQVVIDLLTVRETSFFRQQSWWDAVVKGALEPILAARRRAGVRRLRCVCIGCASGEEPFSLAMTVDRLLGGEPGWRVEIVGVDVCAAALAQARAGLFDTYAVREVSEADRRARFQSVGRRNFALAAEVRAKVDFHLFNLGEVGTGGAAPGLPGGPADLVMCRNVLIHMEPARQPLIARFLRDQVAEGGMLAVAPVEATAAWFAPMQFHASGPAILFSKPEGAAPAPARAAVARRPPEPVAAKPVPPAPAPAVVRHGGEDAARLRRARRLADIGLFEEARHLCAQVLAQDPEADLLMALVCQALGDMPAAEAAAHRCLEAAPLSPAAHYVFAIVCLRAGRTERARKALREAVRLIDGAHTATPRHLGIAADEIRQAARRLGVVPPRGGEHGRSH